MKLFALYQIQCWQTVNGFKSPPTQSLKPLSVIAKDDSKYKENEK